MRSQRTRPFWLRRDSARCQSRPTWNRKRCQRRVVHGHSVIADVPTAPPPAATCPTSGMGSCMRRRSSAFTSFSFACSRLRIVCRSTVNTSVAPLLPADMREAEKVERLRLPFSAPLPVFGRKRSELQQPRFLGMQFQVELPHSSRPVPPGTARHPLYPGIPPRCRPQIARRSRRRAPASDATLGPTGRTRSGDRRWPTAAMHCRPGASLLPLVSASHPPARRRSAISG